MKKYLLHSGRTYALKLSSIFIGCLLIRILFKLLTGYDNFELFGDSIRYDALSQKIIEGNADMDIVAYLTAPLYPYTLALFKWISFDHWQALAVGYQFVLVALSAVSIFMIGQHIWKDERVAAMGALIYILNPMTMWFNFTLAQETTFQVYFIIFLFLFIKNLEKQSLNNTLLSATFFALAILTKSHILMLIPFVGVIYLMKMSWKHLALFVGIVFVFTLPHGLKNYYQHGVFTLSSQGNGSLFILGHNDVTYDCLFTKNDPLEEIACDPTFVFDLEHYYPEHGKINSLSPKERNRKRWLISWQWIKEHPKKFVALKLFGLKRFILPGLDKNQYPKSIWLASFLIGCCLYIPAYITLIGTFNKNPILHSVMLSLIVISFLIFVVFFPINRFRVITMEPLLCVYSGRWYVQTFELFVKKRYA